MNAFEIYLIMMATSFKLTLIIPSVFLLVLSLLGTMHLLSDCTVEDEVKIKKLRKKYSTILFCTLLIGVFIPKTEILLTMYTVPRILDNKQVQILPEKLLRLVNDRLDTLLTSDEVSDEANH